LGRPEVEQASAAFDVPAEREEAAQRRDALVERLNESAASFLEMLTLYVGERLGLYAALAARGWTNAGQLAAATRTSERYVREWLEQQAAGGFLEVQDAAAPPEERRFRLPAGHAEVLVEGDSLAWLGARPKSLVAVARKLPALLQAFRSGEGVADTDAEAREAQAELGRAAYLQLLGSRWIPAVPDVHARLRAVPPAHVADVACGGGWSAIALALAYPGIVVDAFDSDAESIELARRNAAARGVADRVRFTVADAAAPPIDGPCDLVIVFEALHDMPRPVEALRAIRCLAGDRGTVLVVDEKVEDAFEPNADLLTRLNYGWSVLSCLSSAMLGPEPAGTGTVMRPATLEAYATAAGFTAVDRLGVEHPFWNFYRLR
jgi:2-polyprenyl-3-methyl-5-hydroxy-6-metoxy-1,4-benzoquinol methylase